MDYKIFILIVLLLMSCIQSEPSRVEFALGTVCSVTLFDQARDNVYNDIFFRIHEIENLMSVHIPASDISRVNAAAGAEQIQVNTKTFKVIERAVYFAEKSGGAFDPSVGPIVSLWGINSDNPRIPSQEEINEVLPLVNWRNIELDAETNSVFLAHHGMALDLGAIAKGYAADEAARIIKEAGIKRAKIDLGGNIIMLGEREDRNPWRVGIQNPGKDRGSIVGVLQITEQTIVTSGIYERFFEENGIRYHHLFDPATGYPAENGLLSVTVITDISMDADALSTAIFVLGFKQGMALLEFFPGTEAVFIFEDKSIRMTSGVNFTLTDNTYRVKQ